MRVHHLEEIRCGKPRVLNEQVVKMRGTTPPNPQHKERFRHNRLFNRSIQTAFLACANTSSRCSRAWSTLLAASIESRPNIRFSRSIFSHCAKVLPERPPGPKCFANSFSSCIWNLEFCILISNGSPDSRSTMQPWRSYCFVADKG